MLADLLACDGVRETAELRSSVGFMALHGGLEASTAEIATEAARRCGASLYTVVQPENLHWHVPSKLYLPGESERLDAFCAHVDVVISLHGYGGVRESEHRWVTLLVGGSARSHAAVVAEQLRGRLADYVVLDDIDVIPRQYRGLHPGNPVNRPGLAGVQIELTPRVRGTSPIWADHDFEAEPWVPHTAALIEGLVAAASELDP